LQRLSAGAGGSVAPGRFARSTKMPRTEYQRLEGGTETRAAAVLDEDGRLRFFRAEILDTVAQEFAPHRREYYIVRTLIERGLSIRGLSLDLDDDWGDHSSSSQEALRWTAGAQEILDTFSDLADIHRSLNVENACGRERAERLLALLKEGEILCDCEMSLRARAEAFLRRTRSRQPEDPQILEIRVGRDAPVNSCAVDYDPVPGAPEDQRESRSDFDEAPAKLRESVTRLRNRFGSLRPEVAADRQQAEIILAFCEEAYSIMLWWASWRADTDALTPHQESRGPVQGREDTAVEEASLG
jgi:hypothetical protein